MEGTHTNVRTLATWTPEINNILRTNCLLNSEWDLICIERQEKEETIVILKGVLNGVKFNGILVSQIIPALTGGKVSVRTFRRKIIL